MKKQFVTPTIEVVYVDRNFDVIATSGGPVNLQLDLDDIEEEGYAE